MNENDDVTLTPEQEERLRLAIYRMRANLLNFPALCAKAVCRRARKCSANPAVCMDDIGRDVPDDVRHAVDEVLFGKLAGRPFDEMLAEAPNKIDAWWGWLEKVKASAATLDAIRHPKAKKTPDGLSTS
jgi:broad specificity phosphatase PhoE